MHRLKGMESEMLLCVAIVLMLYNSIFSVRLYGVALKIGVDSFLLSFWYIKEGTVRTHVCTISFWWLTGQFSFPPLSFSFLLRPFFMECRQIGGRCWCYGLRYITRWRWLRNDGRSLGRCVRYFVCFIFSSTKEKVELCFPCKCTLWKTVRQHGP